MRLWDQCEVTALASQWLPSYLSSYSLPLVLPGKEKCLDDKIVIHRGLRIAHSLSLSLALPAQCVRLEGSSKGAIHKWSHKWGGGGFAKAREVALIWYWQGEGGGPKSRNFSWRHLYMPPFKNVPWPNFEIRFKLSFDPSIRAILLQHICTMVST